MMFNRKAVFDGLRADFGKLDHVQVSVVAAMLDEFERRKLPDMRWLSYMLATGWGESKWKPVREAGRGKGKKYGKPHSATGKVYYGRGCPTQLTWHENYVAMGKILNLPLAADPDMALIVAVGVAIGFEGMIRGTFTGRKLADYFSVSVDDPVNARRIINRMDKAKQIAATHDRILTVLKAAVRREVAQQPLPDVVVPADAPVARKKFTREHGDLVVNKITPTVIAGGGAVVAGFPWWQVALIALGVLVVAMLISHFVNKESKANE